MDDPEDVLAASHLWVLAGNVEIADDRPEDDVGGPGAVAGSPASSP